MPLEVLVSPEYTRDSEKGIGPQAIVKGSGLRATGLLLLCALSLQPLAFSPVHAAAGGKITGRISFSGPEPGNKVIRMGMDPMCAAVNRGKQVVNEIYAVGDQNALGNVFVKVEGTFPATPVPSQPVEIDQRSCIYVPRMIGARVGQTLVVKNSDNWLHNIHTDSARRNAINQSTPQAGMTVKLALKDEEILRVGCDVHRWMTAWVGVVSHPYFAVSDTKTGTFTIANVPAGRRSVTAWHESFGALTKSVDIKDGQTVTVDFVYVRKPSA